MKKILVLTKNEYKKLFGKISTYILLGVLMALVLLISSVKPYSYDDDYWQDYWLNDNIDMKQYQITELNKELSSASTEEKILFQVEIAILENQIELLNQTKTLSFKGYNDWRMEYIYTNLDSEEYIYTYEYLLQHPEHANILSQRYYLDEDNYNQYKQKRLEIERILKENNYAETKRELYNSSLADLNEAKAQLIETKNQIDTAKDGEFRVFVLEGVVFALNQKVEIFELFFKNDYDYYSYPEQTASIAIDVYSGVAEEYRGFHSETDYNAIIDSVNIQNLSYEYVTNNYREKKSYKAYYSDTIDRINDFQERGLIAKYALENDVTEISIANDVRQKSFDFFSLFWLFAPFLIFFASGMVSKEFSARTINLLLIRPAKRWKVLLAKYLCIVSFALGTIALSAGIYLLGSGLSYGFSDFANPHIYVVNGVAQNMNFFVFFGGKILIAFLSVLALLSLTFMFSTLLKSTAASLILGVFTMLSSVFVFFLKMFVGDNIISYLPFPYISLWTYVLDDVAFLINEDYNIFENLFKANITYGAWFMAVITVLAMSIAFIRFEKMDIK